MRWAAMVLFFIGCTNVTNESVTVIPPASSTAGDMVTGDAAVALDMMMSSTDFSSASDMASSTVVDMDPPSADMTPACGTIAGAACCTSPNNPPSCNTRDANTSQFLICSGNTCAVCGTQGQLCCSGNMCFGGTSCAPPSSANAGHCA